MSDLPELLRRARAGDPEATGELLERHRAYLSLLARRALDQRVQARVAPSDIVQQTMLEAQRDLVGFRGQNSAEFAAWLRHILQHNVHEILDQHLGAQKRAVTREQRLPTDEGDTGHPRQLPADNQSSPSQRAMRGEQAVQLAEAIESLPTDQREAIRLRYLEGLTLKELAEQLDRSEAAVAGLLKRGLRKLRDWFDNASI